MVDLPIAKGHQGGWKDTKATSLPQGHTYSHAYGKPPPLPPEPTRDPPYGGVDIGPRSEKEMKRLERIAKLQKYREDRQARISDKRQRLELRRLQRQERSEKYHIGDAQELLRRIKTYNWKPEPRKHIHWNVGYDPRSFNIKLNLPNLKMDNLEKKLNTRFNFKIKNMKFNKTKGGEKIW